MRALEKAPNRVEALIFSRVLLFFFTALNWKTPIYQLALFSLYSLVFFRVLFSFRSEMFSCAGRTMRFSIQYIITFFYNNKNSRSAENARAGLFFLLERPRESPVKFV